MWSKIPKVSFLIERRALHGAMVNHTGKKVDANVGTPAQRAHALSIAPPNRRSDAWIDAYVMLEHVAAGDFGAFDLSAPTKLAGKATRGIGITSNQTKQKLRVALKDQLAERAAALSGDTPIRPMPPLTPALTPSLPTSASTGLCGG